MAKGLNERQKLFVAEYVKDLNATQAAIRAGYSNKTAKQAGQRLLTFVDVKAEILAATKQKQEAAGVDAAWLLKRLATEAEADLADIYTESGMIKPVHEWPLIWRQGLVMGIDTLEEKDEAGNVIGLVQKIKISDRVKRMELIGKHVDVQAFKDQIAQTGGITIKVLAEDAEL
ncbi:MAG: terminase small subunit [Hyphomicrobiaceae bacterium]|nr:MAG: terminase small subunit [Hyphomicrobiaceae bacterium]